ncbi:hypothetical protein MKW94_001957 [Papaver nudicaule]|uniref:S-protein homolog n=1 Tax=Papaver nudicaule TaxID=74823 RepID=A0AA42B5F9_PAPNU|nr:hypothetical protein [Papaver nudicaule]MCL7052110.1 hypothetical protein [Papaver nudicaule]
MGISSHGSSIQVCFFLFSILVSKGLSSSDPTIVVQVQNDIDQTVLKIHCKSLDQDLGKHALNFRNEWHWRFRAGSGTTYFSCHYQWYDKNDKRYYQGSHEVYKGGFIGFEPKYDILCQSKCVWSARWDGIYLYRSDKEMWERRFVWDP